MAGTKRIFFDTNIFNHIVERDDATELIERLRRVEADPEIELVTGIHVIKELSATPNPDKRQRLAECALVLGSGKIIKGWGQLAQEELLSCRQGQELPSAFYEEREQQSCCTVLKDIAAGRFSDQSARWQKEMGEERKRARVAQMELWKKYQSFTGDFRSSYPTFEKFYEQACRPAASNQLRKLLRKDGVGESELDEAVLRVMSKQDARVLPHLNAFLRAAQALTWIDRMGWQQGSRYCTKPKWGDRVDVGHLICAATSEALVCDDEKARTIFGCVYPGKMALTLEEFVAMLGVQANAP